MGKQRYTTKEIIQKLREADMLIEQWRNHYNRVRPHNALGYRPPAPEAWGRAPALGSSSPLPKGLPKLTSTPDQSKRAEHPRAGLRPTMTPVSLGW